MKTYNNEKNLSSMPSFRDIYKYLFVLNIAYQIIFNSSWRYTYTNKVWLYLDYSFFAVVFIMAIFQFFFRKYTLKRLLYFCFLFVIGLVGLKFRNVSIMLVVLYSFYVYFMDYREIITSFFYGTLLGVVSVSFLAILGLLPMHDNIKGFLVLGFRNPNTLGFYMIMLIMEYVLLKWDKPNRIMWFVYGAISFFEVFIIKDSTAFVMSIVFLLLFLIFRFKPVILANKGIRIFLTLLPVILTAVSLYLASTFGQSVRTLKWNILLTNRLYIWNYYFQNYPPQLFPQKIEVVTNWIVNTPGNGAFDGAYIYFLIYNGYFFAGVFIALFCYFIWNCFKYARYDVLIMTITIIVSGFTETIMFSSYQSPVILMATAAMGGILTNIKEEV